MPPLSWLGRHAEAVLIILVMGLISGLVQFVTNVRAGRERFSVATLIGECVVSGSAALIAGLALLGHVPEGVAFSAAGVAGHMGTRFLFLVEMALSDWMRRRGGPQ